MRSSAAPKSRPDEGQALPLRMPVYQQHLDLRRRLPTAHIGPPATTRRCGGTGSGLRPMSESAEGSALLQPSLRQDVWPGGRRGPRRGKTVPAKPPAPERTRQAFAGSTGSVRQSRRRGRGPLRTPPRRCADALARQLRSLHQAFPSVLRHRGFQRQAQMGE